MALFVEYQKLIIFGVEETRNSLPMIVAVHGTYMYIGSAYMSGTECSVNTQWTIVP